MADEIKAFFRISGPDLDTDEIIVGRQGLRAGRGADNSLVLNHREISRQHMRVIWREDDTYLVEDLNSSNGVFFNETRIPSRVPQELNIGDSIRVGPYTLVLERLLFTQRPVALARTVDGEAPPPVIHDAEVAVGHPMGIPRDRSSWLQYLPAIYSDDEFLGRFLLIFESLLAPVVWTIDNLDLYFSPETAPAEWLRWIGSWFDILIVPDLPEERQREILRQIGWLFLRRGTKAGLERLLELYFGVMPEIIEDAPCHFVVRLPLSQSPHALGADLADRLIDSQRPAFASYRLEVV
jgi:phage tail-like protein